MKWAEHLIKRHLTLFCLVDFNVRFPVIVWNFHYPELIIVVRGGGGGFVMLLCDA